MPGPDGSAADLPKIIPVIMSGGSGTRLWPLSTEQEPKQFHALTGDLTLLQQTVLRVRQPCGVRFLEPLIVCNRRHRDLVDAQLDALGVTPAALVLEPFGRNTAAVAVIAARMAAQIDPDAQVLLLPADHVIADEDAFRAVVTQGAEVGDRIVTFGIEPTAPETGYGYIQRGEALSANVFTVARFAEKPSRAVAEAYLTDGGYYWNGGIFLFSPQVMIAEMGVYRPDILSAASAALAAAQQGQTDAARAANVVELGDDLFAQTPSESIDIALMERTRLAAVAPCDAGWADVGSWSELWRLGARDAHDNLVHGQAAVLDSRDALIWSQDMTVGVLGMSDVIVVANNGAVIVLPKSRAQEVKTIWEQVMRMRAAPQAGR